MLLCIFLYNYTVSTDKRTINGGQRKGKVKYTASFSTRPNSYEDPYFREASLRTIKLYNVKCWDYAPTTKICEQCTISIEYRKDSTADT